MKMNKLNQIAGAALISATLLYSVTACGTAGRKDAPGKSGFITAVKGLGHLVLSPLQISAGLLEGVASLPYYAATGLNEINDRLNSSQASVSLDDTYEAAYGKRLSEVNENGDTGEVFRRMKHATKFFQKVLRQYGVSDYQNYLLTSIDTASRDGYTLFAVVHRPKTHIQVKDKYDLRNKRSLSASDRLFYEPYRNSFDGSPLDKVIDFGGMATRDIGTQKMQAILLTLAANSVVRGDNKPEYWNVERRWISGEFRQVMNENITRLNKRMNIKN